MPYFIFQQIDYINKDGIIMFEDGHAIDADIIFHCTGYDT